MCVSVHVQSAIKLNTHSHSHTRARYHKHKHEHKHKVQSTKHKHKHEHKYVNMGQSCLYQLAYQKIFFSHRGLIRDKSKPLTLTTIRSILADVCDGLAHLHAHGIIHRDMKPGNVLLDGENQAFIADFGNEHKHTNTHTNSNTSKNERSYVTLALTHATNHHLKGAKG